MILLSLIYWAKWEFDAKTFADELRMCFPQLYCVLTQKQQLPPPRAILKSVSNDLDRLYRMGFLSATRAKRETRTMKGKQCHRGFKYVYRFTIKGSNHLAYFSNPQAVKEMKSLRKPEPLFKYQLVKLSICSQYPAMYRVFDMLDKELPVGDGSLYYRFPNRVRKAPLLQNHAAAMYLLSKHGEDLGQVELGSFLFERHIKAEPKSGSRIFDVLSDRTDVNHEYVITLIRTMIKRILDSSLSAMKQAPIARFSSDSSVAGPE